MAGSNPYPLHSFRELRAVLRRPLSSANHAQVCSTRNTARPPRHAHDDVQLFGLQRRRRAGFHRSCGDGLQYDPRPRPLRQPLAASRLRTLHALADPFGHHAAARESLPQRERPRREAEPRYRLRAIPFTRGVYSFAPGRALHSIQDVVSLVRR